MLNHPQQSRTIETSQRELAHSLGFVAPEVGHEGSLLVTEANHRIANSLMLLVSFLRLQSVAFARRTDQIEPDEVAAALDDAAARVDTIATVHRLLSRCPTGAMVDLPEFLRELCSTVLGSISAAAQTTLDWSDNGSCKIAAPRMTSVALIVVEMLTNAVKYAHPSGIDGYVRFECRSGNGEVMVEVADDGVGLPEGFDPAMDGGLGFRIIRSLAEQLEGQVTFRSTPLGLTTRLTIPV